MPTALADAIGILRIRAPFDDPATRMACADAVCHAQLPKRGSSSKSVLVLRSTSVRSAPNHDLVAFTAELNRRVEQGWRAASPAGPAALGADAVEFRDLTQLVAMYVADLASGQVGERWWWSAISRLLAGAGDAHAVLGAHIELVPHVVTELHGAGQLGEVIGALNAGACEDLVRRLAAEFAAPRLAAAVDEVRGIMPQSALAVDEVRGIVPQADLAAAKMLPPSVASAGAAVQPLTLAARPVHDIGAMRRLLVVIALRLAMDTLDARSSRFAREAVRFALAPVEDAIPPHDPADAPAGAGLAEHGRSAQRANGQRFPATAGHDRGVVDEPNARRNDDRADAEPPAAGVRSRADNPAPGEPALGERARRSHPPQDRADLARADGRSTAPIADDDESPRHDAADRVTELGGVFFLIEPVRELRLPERFGPDGRLADRLGWWGTIELVARRLLPYDPVLADDPIWTVLAELGGCSAVDRAPSLEIADVRGTVVWDPDLTSIDILSLDTSLARTCRGAVREWSDEVGPWIAATLVSRLRCDPAELQSSLLLRRATVLHDRTHVDVHFPLASATVAVRRVGFDRDPGWVPELGRAIAFHFGGRVGGD
jgi:hypothetical protein